MFNRYDVCIYRAECILNHNGPSNVVNYLTRQYQWLPKTGDWLTRI